MKKNINFITFTIAIIFCFKSVYSYGKTSDGTVYDYLDAKTTMMADSIFEDIEGQIPDYTFSSINWGDYDNDGDLDFVISGALDVDGDTFADSSVIDIYENIGGQFSRLSTSNFYGLHIGAVQFIDIDMDNDLDLITTGQNYVDILEYPLIVYINDDGIFSPVQTLEGAIFCSLNTGDFDLDGDLDLLISGVTENEGRQTKIFTNDAGTLVNSGISLPGVQNGDAQFADFDKDGNLDILLMGIDNNDDYLLHYYRNTSNGFELKQEMSGIYYGAFSVSDYDNDGDLDFAVMGDDVEDEYAALLYTFEGDAFGTPDTLIGVDNASGYSPIDWGDYNNDGYRDLVMAGTDVDFEDVTLLYQNDGTSLTLADEGLRQLGGNTAVGFADFDQDNDMDVIISGSYFTEDFDYLPAVVLHRNTIDIVNQKPSAPTSLSANFNATNDSISFAWNDGADDLTAAPGLYYWLEVTRDSDNQLVLDYPVYGKAWTVKLPADNYSWSIRAVDAADVFSDPATSQLVFTSVQNPVPIDFEIFPNPVTDWLQFRSSSVDVTHITIYNSLGQVVREGQPNINQFDVSNLTAGVYQALVHTADDLSFTLKFVKK